VGVYGAGFEFQLVQRPPIVRQKRASPPRGDPQVSPPRLRRTL